MAPRDAVPCAGDAGATGQRLQRIGSLPLVPDAHVRASLDILACVPGAAINTDIKLHLALMGVYGRLLTTHGLHGRVSSAIALLALSTASRGRIREAESLCDLVRSS